MSLYRMTFFRDASDYYLFYYDDIRFIDKSFSNSFITFTSDDRTSRLNYKADANRRNMTTNRPRKGLAELLRRSYD